MLDRVDVDAPDQAADAVWADVVARLWPLAHRDPVLLALGAVSARSARPAA